MNDDNDLKQMRERMRNVIANFIPVLDSWTDKETGALLDPFETDYSENYAPANAAFIYAGVYRFSKDSDHLDKCLRMVRRSVQLLKDKKHVNPFCRVFLFHYSLGALLLLPEEDRQQAKQQFADFYAGYEDDCGQINTNCAALQWGMEMFADSLGYRKADLDHAERLVSYVEHAQLPSGFINDSVESGEVKDGMPIAYHLFILFILKTVLTLSVPKTAEQKNHAERMAAVVRRGMSWLGHALSMDGTLAMAERSRYQMFTWGALTAVLSTSECRNEPMFELVFANWLKYKQADGSYSCVPNYLPHNMRCGFERYTRINMYNNLGMTGIILADKILSDALDKSNQQELIELKLPAENRFADLESGYAFFRKNGAFFACALRTHDKGYIHSMQGFHYRLGEVPLPLAEPIMQNANHFRDRGWLKGIWEGFMFTTGERKEQRHVFPQSTQNAQFAFLPDGVEFVLETDDYRCKKQIRASKNRLIWKYAVEPKAGCQRLHHVVPLLLHDGKHHAKVKLKTNQLAEIRFAGHLFQLECHEALEMRLSLDRSLASVSGAAATLHISLPANAVSDYMSAHASSGHSPLSERLNQDKEDADNLRRSLIEWETKLVYAGPAEK